MTIIASALEITYSIGAVLTGGFSNAFKQANQAMNALQGQGKDLQKAMKDIGAYQKMQGTLSQTSDKLNQARARVKELGLQMRATDSPSEALKAQFTQANKEAHELENTLGAQRKELAALGKALTTAGVDTKNLTAEQQRLTQQSQRVLDAQNKLAKARANYAKTREALSFDNIKGDLIKAAGVSMSLAAPTMSAADYEMANARLNAVAFSGAGRNKMQDEKDFIDLKEQSRQLARETQYNAVEVTKSQENFARAGFKTSEIISAMPGALSMATAEGMDLATGVDIMASAIRGFNLDASNSTRVSNILAQTSSSSNSSITGLGESLKYVAPLASNLGISIEETSAILGKMADAGIKGSQGGTALRAALSRITEEPKRVAEAFAQFGVVAADASGNLRELPELMIELDAKLKGMGNKERGSVLMKIFGQEAGPAMMAVMKSSVDKSLQQLTRFNRESSGELQALEKVSSVSLESFRESMQTSDKQARKIGVSFGELGTYIALLADSGIKGAQADKALTIAFTQLSSKPKQVESVLKSFNMTAYDSEGYVKNFTQILTELDKATQTMTSAEKLKTFEKVFGSNTGASIQALIQGINSANYATYSNAVSNSQGISSEMSSKMINTLQGQIEIAKSAIGDLAITTGDVLLPSVKVVVQAFTSFTSAIGEFAANNPIITKTIVGLVGGLGSLSVGITAAKYAWLALKLPIDTVKVGMAAMQAKAILLGDTSLILAAKTKVVSAAIKTWSVVQTAFNAVMNANPIMLLVTAIGALVAAGVVFYQNWDKIVEWWNNSSLKDFFSPIIEWSSNAIANVKGIWEDFVNWLSSLNPFSSWKAPMPDAKTVESGKKAIIEKHGTTDLRPSYMKAFATGGIISRPVIGLVGEAGKEAIIPLEKQSLGAALWLKAGQELGMIDQSRAQSIDYVNANSLSNIATNSINAQSLLGLIDTSFDTNSESLESKLSALSNANMSLMSDTRAYSASNENTQNLSGNSTGSVINPIFNITFNSEPENEADFMSMFRAAWEKFREQEMRLSFA